MSMNDVARARLEKLAFDAGTEGGAVVMRGDVRSIRVVLSALTAAEDAARYWRRCAMDEERAKNIARSKTWKNHNVGGSWVTTRVAEDVGCPSEHAGPALSSGPPSPDRGVGRSDHVDSTEPAEHKPEVDLLHPDGRCACAGEGTCTWCLSRCMACGAGLSDDEVRAELARVKERIGLWASRNEALILRLDEANTRIEAATKTLDAEGEKTSAFFDALLRKLSRYRHHTGKIYTAERARDGNTGEELIAYRGEDGALWVHKRAAFFRVQDGRPRFEQIPEGETLCPGTKPPSSPLPSSPSSSCVGRGDAEAPLDDLGEASDTDP